VARRELVALTLFFARSGPGLDIMRATRDGVDGPFSNIVPFVATSATEGSPNVGATDLYYTGLKPNKFAGIYVRPLASTDATDPAASRYLALPMADGNDRFHDNAPVLDDSELTLYFASGRDTLLHSIYVATRATREAPFSVPQRVDALSSDASEFPGWLSPDGCRMYLLSNREPTDQPKYDVYIARRSP
jgi:hypothetical protein